MSLARLVYIAFKLKKLPKVPKAVRRYFTYEPLLISIAEKGIEVAANETEGNSEQLKALVKQGRASGIETSEEEYRNLVAGIVFDEIKEASVTYTDALPIYTALDAFVKGKNILETEASTFGIVPGEDDNIIVPCGFTPLDEGIGGLPKNALTLFLARPGNGKTSIMLAIADSYKGLYPETKIVWVSYEMVASAVHKRAQYLKNLNSKDVLLCGQTTLPEIEEHIDDKTLLIIDYADKMVAGSDTEGYRFQIQNVYHKMLSLSKRCKGVITASQVRRIDKDISIDSPDESASKAHISELMVAINKGAHSVANIGYDKVELKIVKNRYGQCDTTMSMDFNFRTLEYVHTGIGQCGIDLATDLEW